MPIIGISRTYCPIKQPKQGLIFHIVSQKNNLNMKYRFKNSSMASFIRYTNKLYSLEPLVEQERLTLPEHLSSPPVFSGFVLLDL
jgi:hypothetical protein